MKLVGEVGVQNVLGLYPTAFLGTIALLVYEILQYPTLASRIQDLSYLIGLLAVHDDGRGTLHSGLVLVPLSSRTTSGLEQGDMKSG
jgi:hypothetical protein